MSTTQKKMTASNDITSLVTEIRLSLGDLQTRIKNVETTIASIDRKLESQYVTQDQLKIRLQPLEQGYKIVYTVVGLILLTFAGVWIAGIIPKI